MGLNTQVWRSAKRAELLERQLRVAELYLVDRKTQRQIAKMVGVSTAQVHLDLKACKAMWREQARLLIDEHIAVELQKIAANESEAHAAYERSRKPKRVASATKRVGQLTGEETVSSATQIERDEGDPRWFAAIQKCTDQRIKLLGLGGQEDDAETAKKKKGPLTFEDFVAAHQEKQVYEAGPRRLSAANE